MLSDSIRKCADTIRGPQAPDVAPAPLRPDLASSSPNVPVEGMNDAPVRSPAPPGPLLPVYPPFPVTPVSGRGCTLLDAEGREWLDFYGGHAVASTGHSHPRVVAAIAAQAAESERLRSAVSGELRATRDAIAALRTEMLAQMLEKMAEQGRCRRLILLFEFGVTVRASS